LREREQINDSTGGKPPRHAHSDHEEMVAMRSGVISLPRGRRWLRRHVEVVPDPGVPTAVVTARTTAPQIAISVRRHPVAGRTTIEEAGS
jgi:hypothetical protein